MYMEIVKDIYSWVLHTSQFKYSEGIQVLNNMSTNRYASGEQRYL